jgi:hypothetical protein
MQNNKQNVPYYSQSLHMQQQYSVCFAVSVVFEMPVSQPLNEGGKSRS